MLQLFEESLLFGFGGVPTGKCEGRVKPTLQRRVDERELFPRLRLFLVGRSRVFLVVHTVQLIGKHVNIKVILQQVVTSKHRQTIIRYGWAVCSSLALLLLAFLCEEGMLQQSVRFHPFIWILLYQILDKVAGSCAHSLRKDQLVLIHLCLCATVHSLSSESTSFVLCVQREPSPSATRTPECLHDSSIT